MANVFAQRYERKRWISKATIGSLLAGTAAFLPVYLLEEGAGFYGFPIELLIAAVPSLIGAMSGRYLLANMIPFGLASLYCASRGEWRGAGILLLCGLLAAATMTLYARKVRLGKLP